jgi:TPR repeat protein
MEASKWYKKAAEQGVAFAQCNLGFMYQNGQGVPQDYTEAFKWGRMAAEQGDGIAQLNLGVAYSNDRWLLKDYLKAYFWYSLAVSRLTGENYKKALDAKNLTAIKLSPEKLAEAQSMIIEWEKSHLRK